MSSSFSLKKPTPVMLISLLGMFIALAFQLYLSFANHHHVSNAKFSPILAQKDVLTESSFHKTNKFTNEIEMIKVFIKSYGFIAGAAVMLLGIMPLIWGKVQSKRFFKNHPTLNYYTQAALFIIGQEVVNRLVIIPGAFLLGIIFGVHVRVGLFEVQGLVVEIIGIFIMMGIFSKTGKAFPFIVAAAIPILMHIAAIIGYYVIAAYSVPFDFSTPHGKAIQPLLEQQGFPLSHVFLFSRFPMVNVAYSGTWAFSRMIVVFEPILEVATPEQLLGIIGHELGHGAHFHQLRGEFYYAIVCGLFAFICYQLLFKKSIYEAFGFTDKDYETPSQNIEIEKKQQVTTPFVPKLVLAMTIIPWLFAPLFTFNSHASMALIHFGEYQADRHTMGFGLAGQISELFLKMLKHSMHLVSHPVYDYVKHTHPTMLRRINRLGIHELYE